jgi:hypothetical protein
MEPTDHMEQHSEKQFQSMSLVNPEAHSISEFTGLKR